MKKISPDSRVKKEKKQGRMKYKNKKERKWKNKKEEKERLVNIEQIYKLRNEVKNFMSVMNRLQLRRLH